MLGVIGIVDREETGVALERDSDRDADILEVSEDELIEEDDRLDTCMVVHCLHVRLHDLDLSSTTR